MPTFLFRADVEAKKLYWTAIQLDQKVLDILEQGKTKSLTVRMPTANILPDKFDQFARDLMHAQTVVVSRILLQTTHVELVEAMKSQPVEQISQVAEDLHVKGYRLQLDAAFVSGKMGISKGRSRRFTKWRRAPVRAAMSRFNSTRYFQAGELEWMLVSKSEAPQARTAETKLETALELCRIAKRKPKHLHLYAQIMRRSAELSVEAQQEHSGF